MKNLEQAPTVPVPAEYSEGDVEAEDAVQIKAALGTALQHLFDKELMMDSPYLKGVLVDNYGVPLEALIQYVRPAVLCLVGLFVIFWRSRSYVYGICATHISPQSPFTSTFSLSSLSSLSSFFAPACFVLIHPLHEYSIYYHFIGILTLQP